jgi:hypothetical protein
MPYASATVARLERESTCVLARVSNLRLFLFSSPGCHCCVLGHQNWTKCCEVSSVHCLPRRSCYLGRCRPLPTAHPPIHFHMHHLQVRTHGHLSWTHGHPESRIGNDMAKFRGQLIYEHLQRASTSRNCRYTCHVQSRQSDGPDASAFRSMFTHS